MSIDLTSLLGKSYHLIRQLIINSGHDPAYEPADEDTGDGGYFSPVGFGLEATIGRDDLIDTFHIHTDDHHGFEGYVGKLPDDVAFTMSRDEVRAQLGEPDKEGGPHESLIDSMLYFWDSWDRSDYSLHCEYPLGQDAITMVTISRRKPNKAEMATPRKLSD